MALTPHYSLFTYILQSIDLKPATYRSVGCASARRSNEQRRTKLKSFSFMLRRAVLREGQGQGAQVSRNEAYIHVRRSDEGRRATPKLAFWHNSSGFSYLGVLILVAVMSISIVGTGRYWSTIVKRELEAELLYRGDRIREAIASYYNNPPGGQNKTYPRKFSDLLKDPRYPGVKRHLRKWYTDPMNQGKDWVYILDASQKLKGVHSAHEGTPLKTGNFPKDYSEFEQAQTYEDWTFVFVPKQ
jgi:type II secretory pathway pseudopilin PulG